MPGELTSIPVGEASIERYRSVLEPELWREFSQTMAELTAGLHGRVLWNINSTGRGGGVAELLAALLPYLRGCRIDVRWLVIDGSPEFFSFTKCVHNLLHGAIAGGGQITSTERARYEQTLADNARALGRDVKSRDVVILHDPQAAGLIPALVRLGCHVIWRCHVGIDRPNAAARVAWDFLRPYVLKADASVFSRQAYVWDGLDPAQVHIIAPSIDPFTPKNRELDDHTVAAILDEAGILPSRARESRDGVGVVKSITRTAEMIQLAVPPADARLVVQVSRWDGLKDPLGVMEGFARHVVPHSAGHLILAGPAASAIPDDPEGPAMLQRVEEAWHELPLSIRERIHLAGLPMVDLDENAMMVNALQRRAQVIVQKSLAEGFGLTVAEAMWKARPVVATRVGGIQDQIEDGRSGLLIDDPHDLTAFGAAVVRLLSDEKKAHELGTAARQRVRHQFLAPRQLIEEGHLVLKLIQAQPPA